MIDDRCGFMMDVNGIWTSRRCTDPSAHYFVRGNLRPPDADYGSCMITCERHQGYVKYGFREVSFDDFVTFQIMVE